MPGLALCSAGPPREVVPLDGTTAPRIPPGVVGVTGSQRKAPSADARAVAVAGEFRSGSIAERVEGRTWPVAAQRVTVLELHE